MSEFGVERITEITAEVFEAANRLAPQLESPSQVNITEAYLQRIVDNPEYHWLMARRTDDSRLIGMACLIMLPFPTNIRTTLENVVVDKDTRQQGVGTALCEEAKRIALEQGANGIRAAAAKTNVASKSMLEKAGFPVDDVMDHYELWLKRGARF
ncbi:MAG: GNAT family N-acetyltransferase [Candidatus Saccharimonadales bacterium]